MVHNFLIEMQPAKEYNPRSERGKPHEEDYYTGSGSRFAYICLWERDTDTPDSHSHP